MREGAYLKWISKPINRFGSLANDFQNRISSCKISTRISKLISKLTNLFKSPAISVQNQVPWAKYRNRLLNRPKKTRSHSSRDSIGGKNRILGFQNGLNSTHPTKPKRRTFSFFSNCWLKQIKIFGKESVNQSKHRWQSGLMCYSGISILWSNDFGNIIFRSVVSLGGGLKWRYRFFPS